MNEDRTYNSRYWEENKKDLLKKKRDRYKKDSEYRERMRQKARLYYAKKKKQEGTKVYQIGESTDLGSQVVEINGQLYCSASYAAKAAEVSLATLRRWCDSGVVPETLKEKHGRGWRWFTPHQIVLMEKYKGYNKMDRRQKIAVKSYVKMNWRKDGVKKAKKS